MVREKLLQAIERYFEDKEEAKYFTLNTFADIVEDSSDNFDDEAQDVEDKAVIYVNKVAGAYSKSFARIQVDEEWVVGIRTGTPHSKMNFEECEKIMYDLWKYFTATSCNGYEFKVVNNYQVLPKDQKERYFMEFNVHIKN